MVRYYGHFSTKTYMKNKPVIFGIKVRFPASFPGHPFAFQVYTKKIQKKRPLAEGVVKELTEVLEKNLNNILYFDNFLAQQLFAETWLKKAFAALVLFDKLERKVLLSLIRSP